MNDSTVVVVDERGVRTTIPRDQVVSVTAFTGRFNNADPNYARLFISPNGRTLGRGQGRLSSYYIFLPSIAYGVTDRIDVSAAASIPFFESNRPYGVLAATVKAGVVQSERTNVAVGATFGLPYGEGAGGAFAGTFYGLATFGTSESAVTVGAYGGYAGDAFEDEFDGDNFQVGDGAAFLLGYERQLSESLKFMTENYLAVPFTGDGVGTAHLVGLRFFGQQLSADLAVVGFTGDGEIQTIPVPYLSFAYTLGR